MYASIYAAAHGGNQTPMYYREDSPLTQIAREARTPVSDLGLRTRKSSSPDLSMFSTTDLLKIRAILTKYSDDEERDENGRWTAGEGEALTTSLVYKATTAEPGVTKALQEITAHHGGNLNAQVNGHGTLDARLKTTASTRDKVNGYLARGMTPEAAQARMRDNLRYTIVQNPDQWTRTVEGTVTSLKAMGYTPEHCSDHWQSQSGYAGLHTNWLTQDGQMFEVQFHTPESLSTKEEISHPLYTTLRSLDPNDQQAQGIRDQIDQAWSDTRQSPPPSTTEFLTNTFGMVEVPEH